MKKIVLLVSFVGICIASPFLQVSEKEINDDPRIKEAAVLALGVGNNERGCKGAKLSGNIHATYLTYDSGYTPGHIYQLNLDIKKADRTRLRCSVRTTLFDSGAIGVELCNCNKKRGKEE
ncbi:hypothetical protein CHS0354_012960 [Potamilus streckersoni]|uniref:Uncharacterized protein n=1 Tax=Potamilus streckersoni TaxID=2493646 RepID=A0AAE0SMF6_9BIVA|nr:hypothetical protein CHS0354_012960 [Potamilus streckersoni]